MDEAVRIQAGDFSVEAEVEAVKRASRGIGGVAVFLGTARDLSEGREIRAVEFEQYAGMALAELKRLRAELLGRFDVIEARIVHRVALIEPGGNIVLIVVGAAHRAAAFDACRWCIDELKKRVPIWKKEMTPGGEQWVTPHP